MNQGQQTRKAVLEPAEELEHLALAAEISGVKAEIVLPQRREITMPQMRLHYLDWGTAGRRPIVFLHGAALNAHTWDVVCLMLRQHYHCYALDQRGHGESAWAEDGDYSGEAHRGDIEALVNHLGLDQFVLVGHSMGGFNAFNYAFHHNHRLAALVLVDAGPSMLMKGAKRIFDFVNETAELDSLDQVIQKAIEFNPRRDPRLLRRSVLHNFRQNANGKWTRKTDLRMWHGSKNREQERDRLVERFRQAARVNCPTLIVQGSLSDIFTSDDAQKLATEFSIGHYAQVGEAGHTVQGDNPRVLAQVLSQFLDKVLPEKAKQD
ncbi:MAG TPA: alpha/beta hydrolase [Candidatus Angelobacter sp.]|jgi:pimeloyl-ACP methyl ester carboxylesterase|nr:alpha/beta hydrolase [Candidatus Angelobacter sp.]